MTNLTGDNPFELALATNSADTEFASKLPTTNEPSGNGVYDPSAFGPVPNTILVLPCGTDAANEAFDMRIIGWSKDNQATPVWIPVPLFQGTVTLGNIVGYTGSRFLADTIAAASWVNTNTSVEVVSPTGDIPAHIHVDIKGFTLIEFLFDLDSAAGANALVKVLN